MRCSVCRINDSHKIDQMVLKLINVCRPRILHQCMMILKTASMLVVVVVVVVVAMPGPCDFN